MKTLKESFIKAEGSGLSYGLQNLEFIVSSNWPPSVMVSVDASRTHKSIQTTLQSCCEGSRLFIKGELVKDWQFQEYMLDDQVRNVSIILIIPHHY